MKNIKKFLEKDKFAEHSGIELIEVSPGRARASMKIEPYHLNGVGVVHGGAIFTLADLAFAAASNSHGRVAVAINASISYVKASTDGMLYAEATEIAINPKLATYTITIMNDEGTIVASFQGTVYRKRDPIPV